MKNPDYLIFTDGSCIGPGYPMGWGFIVYDAQGKFIHKESDWSEESDNNSCNVAEYMALHDAILWTVRSKINDKRLIFFSDSKLLCKQMAGRWQIHEGRYKEIAEICRGLSKTHLAKRFFKWIPRELNEEADKLSREYESTKT